MSSKNKTTEQGFKVVGYFRLIDLESVETFRTLDDAARAARKWRDEAKAEGNIMNTRVVKAKKP